VDLIKSANLALRFLLELCALAATAYWGATGDGGRGRRAFLAVAAPVVVGVVWMLFVAPGATIHTPPALRFVVELTVFTAAASALLQRGHLVLASALGLGYAVNRALMAVWDQ
jgi:hypothetical protein